MITIDATYSLTTPAFLGGAPAGAGGPCAEFRLASFKGALRFWWRALQGATTTDARALHRREALLFGGADPDVGRSRVRMHLLEPLRPVPLAAGKSVDALLARDGGARTRGGPARAAHGATYLGYGPIRITSRRERDASMPERMLTRACLQPPLRVPIRLRFDPRPDADAGAETAELVRALVALGTLGGLGARSRRGFGSLILDRLTVDTGDHADIDRRAWADWRPPATLDALSEQIQALYPPAATGGLPEWTALSARACHLLLLGRQDDDGFALLDRVGCELVRFRSYGRDGKILAGEKAKPRFSDDHDLYKAADTKRVTPTTHPRRVVFGLPHNYSKSFQVGPADRDLDRRASPLLVHIHACAGRPVAVLSFLPARFLPAGRDRLRVGHGRVPLARGDDLWAPIHEFFAFLRERRELGVDDVREVTTP